jgi:hypothetical protein
MERVQRSEHVYIRILNTPAGDGILDDADIFPTLTIWDSADKKILTDVSMGKTGTGTYLYQHLVPITSDYGWYRWRVLLVNDGKYEYVDGAFEVV